MRSTLFLISLIFASYTTADELILKENMLGTLPLSKETQVSLSVLKAAFPNHTIEHGIGEGDSPDFHYFDVKDNQSNTIFTIISYIENESDRASETVKLDTIEIYDSQVVDEYGIKTGAHLNDIINKRGKNLKYGANHHGNHIGLNNIWYALSTEELADPNGPDINPENISLEEALAHNPKITAISWPDARW